MPAARSPRIREASFEDYAGIAALETAGGLKAKPEPEWRHLWTGNPVYAKIRGQWPLGWVIEEEGGEIVGSLCNIPVECELDDERLLTAAGRSWVVDERYRSLSLLLMDRFFRQHHVRLFLNTTVNEKATGALSSFGVSRVPSGVWNQSVFWITHYGGFVESYFKKKDIPLASVLRYPASTTLRLARTFAGDGLFRHRPDQRIKFRDRFEDRFDGFWEQLRRKRSRVLMSVRTRDVLDWHFRFGITNKKTWILTRSEGSRLLAYAVFSRKDNARFGLRRMRLMDFQSLDEDSNWLIGMLVQAAYRCRAEDIHMLEIVGYGTRIAAPVEALRPSIRPLDSWLYYYMAADPRLAEQLRHPGAWDPTGFDGDSSL